MARRSDTALRRRGVLRHYHRPLHRDRLFLLVAVSSVLVTGVFVALVVLLTSLPDEPLDWLRPAVLGLLVLLLSFRLLGMGVTSSRKFQEGLRGAPDDGRGQVADTAATRDLEATGRAAGAFVGKALRAARPTPRTPSVSPDPSTDRSSPSPPPSSPDPDDGDHTGATEISAPLTTKPTAATGPTVDRAARVAGAMLGRRMAERRQRHEEN